MTKPYLDALGRPDPALTEHELMRTARDAADRLHALVHQLRYVHGNAEMERDAAPVLRGLEAQVNALQQELITHRARAAHRARVEYDRLMRGPLL